MCYKTPIRLVSCQNTYGNVNYSICAQSVRVSCLCVCVYVSALCLVSQDMPWVKALRSLSIFNSRKTNTVKSTITAFHCVLPRTPKMSVSSSSSVGVILKCCFKSMTLRSHAFIEFICMMAGPVAVERVAFLLRAREISGTLQDLEVTCHDWSVLGVCSVPQASVGILPEIKSSCYTLFKSLFLNHIISQSYTA